MGQLNLIINDQISINNYSFSYFKIIDEIIEFSWNQVNLNEELEIIEETKMILTL